MSVKLENGEHSLLVNDVPDRAAVDLIVRRPPEQSRYHEFLEHS